MKAILFAALAVASVPALAKPQPKSPAPAAKKVVVAEAPKAVETAGPIGVPMPAVVEPAPAAKPASLADMPLEQLSNTVLAGTAAKADKAAASPAVDAVTTLDLGGEYGLKKRQMALPTPDIDIEQFEAKSLDENQVGTIVRERAEDLEYCWLRLPQSKRVVSAAILHLTIEASGKVAAVEVNGDLPAGVGKCITSMAGRWSFPAADAATEIDHGIMLTTTSQKVR